MEQDTLKVCPFCGATPETEFAGPLGSSVWCDNGDCPVAVEYAHHVSKSEAIADWNRRADDADRARLVAQVQRLDSACDDLQIQLSSQKTYAESVEELYSNQLEENERLVAQVAELEQELVDAKRKLIVRPDWKMPPPPDIKCSICNGVCDGAKIVPTAYNTGEGWLLEWACDLCGGGWLEEIIGDKAFIDWPFHDDKLASGEDMRLAGFDVV